MFECMIIRTKIKFIDCPIIFNAIVKPGALTWGWENSVTPKIEARLYLEFTTKLYRKNMKRTIYFSRWTLEDVTYIKSGHSLINASG